MRKTYVWALDIELPTNKPNHEHAKCGFYDGYCSWIDWPRNRKFLSEAGARQRAAGFRDHGAKVTVYHSAPVEFPSMAEVHQQEIEESIEGLRAIAKDLQ